MSTIRCSSRIPSLTLRSSRCMIPECGPYPSPPLAAIMDAEGRKDGPGYLHQVPERMMVNKFIELGYHCVNLFPSTVDLFVELPDNLQFRHGVSVCQRNTILNNDVYDDRSDVVASYSVTSTWNLALPERYNSMEQEAFLIAFCSDHSIEAELCDYLLDRLLTNRKEGEL